MNSMPSTNSRWLSNGNGNRVKQHSKSIKIASTQWIICVWVVFMLAATQTNVYALKQLHIGGIFPIGGKGGWQGNLQREFCYMQHI